MNKDSFIWHNIIITTFTSFYQEWVAVRCCTSFLSNIKTFQHKIKPKKEQLYNILKHLFSKISNIINIFHRFIQMIRQFYNF